MNLSSFIFSSLFRIILMIPIAVWCHSLERCKEYDESCDDYYSGLEKDSEMSAEFYGEEVEDPRQVEVFKSKKRNLHLMKFEGMELGEMNSFNNVDKEIFFILKRKNTLHHLQSGSNAIIVGGDSKSAINALAYFVSGHDDKLVSKESPKDSGNFSLVYKDEKIAAHYWHPQSVRDVDAEKNVWYHEFTGFRESQTSGDDVKRYLASAFMQNKFIQNIQKLKLVHVVDYRNVDVHPNWHINIIQGLTVHLKNVTKFNNSSALVIINADYPKNASNEETAKKSVVEFFKEKFKVSKFPLEYQKHASIFKKNFFKREFLKDDKYSKIGILWSPTESGKLSQLKSSKIHKSKESLVNLIHKNIDYVFTSPDDFDFSLPEQTFDSACSLIHVLQNKIVRSFKEIYEKIKSYIDSLNNDSNDILELHNQFVRAVIAFSDIKISKLKTQIDLLNLITEKMDVLNIPTSNDFINKIYIYDEFINFFETMHKCDGKTASEDDLRRLQNEFQQDIFLHIIDFSVGYKMLSELFLLHDDIIENHKKKIDLKERDLQGAMQFISKMKRNETNLEEYKNLLNSPVKNTIKDKFKKVLDYLYLKPIKTDHKDTNTTVVYGNYVFLSDVPSKSEKNVEIYALEKFYVDSDYAGSSQLSVTAPIWKTVKNDPVKDRFEINLDGINGSPVKREETPSNGYNGEDGIPGKPGSSGGNFFGIYDEFLKASQLMVSSKSGNGSSGVDGEKGRDGTDQYDATILSSSIFLNYTKRIAVLDKLRKDPANSCQHDIGDSVYHCTFVGTCQHGGNGGSGSMGGLPGSGGELVVIPLSQPKSEGDNIILYSMGGSYGKPGKAGAKGKASIPKVTLTYEYIPNLVRISGTETDNYYGIKKKTEACNDGQPGTPPPNPPSNMISPIHFDPLPTDIVATFKAYAMNETTGVRASFSKDFIIKLDNDLNVANFTDNSLGFTSELIILEKLFDPKKPELLLDYYVSLRDRIYRYIKSKKPKDQEKHITLHLGAAVVSKIGEINTHPDDDLIVDLEKALNSIETNFKLYEKQQSIEVAQQRFEAYNKTFQKKIEEAVNFIESQVAADLDKTYKNLNEGVNKLIDEVLALEDKTKKEGYKLKEMQNKMADQLVARKILGVANLVGAALGFLGPAGATAGAVIGGISSVIETVTLDDQSSSGNDKIISLPTSVTAAVTNINTKIKNKKNLFEETLASAKIKLKEFNPTPSSKEGPILTKSIEDLDHKINDILKEYKKIEKKGATYDVTSIDKMNEKRKEWQDLLEKKVELLENNKPPNDISSSKQERLVSYLQQSIMVINAGINFKEKLQNDQAKLDRVVDAMKANEAKLKELDAFEAKVTSTLLSTIGSVENNFTKNITGMNGMSRASLDVSQWKVQADIEELRNTISRMVKGFDVESSFMNYIRRLEKGMDVTIELYKDIERYRDQVFQAAYIKDIFKPDSISVIPDSNLGRKIRALEEITMSNDIRKQYRVAFDAFKRHVFPFAFYYLQQFKLPWDDNIDDNSDKSFLLRTAVDRVKRMVKKLEHDAAYIKDYKHYSYNNIWFRNPLSPKSKSPFYIWKYESIKHILPDLLNGQNVTLDAEVTLALPLGDAIKFNFVDIEFNLVNPAKQDDFNELFELFFIHATHFGNSRYKACGKYYAISTTPQNMSFSVLKRKEDPTLPESTDEVYGDLRRNYPILSPYATWNFILEHHSDTNQIIWNPLKDFLNEPMDMVLSGHGRYVTPDVPSICENADLDHFYRSVDPI